MLEIIEVFTKNLIESEVAANGLQLTKDSLRDTRHFSNTLFNIPNYRLHLFNGDSGAAGL